MTDAVSPNVHRPHFSIRVGFRHLREQRPLLKNLKVTKGKWVVWWYGETRTNAHGRALPHVEVVFRQLLDDFHLGQYQIVYCPITWLGLLSIGSVWEDRLLIGEQDLGKIVGFKVNMSDAQLVTLDDSLLKNQLAVESPQYSLLKYIRPKSISLISDEHNFGHRSVKSWFIRFPLQGKRYLYVPCMEFFARCYGRSQEVKRCLSTYPFRETRDRLYSIPERPEQEGHWCIKLKPDAQNGDAVFLAHTHYDSVSRIRAESIYSQLESLTGIGAKITRPSVSLKVLPWFDGPATLYVQGIHVSDDAGNAGFMALRVVGCTDPSGPPIELDRIKREHPDPSPSLADDVEIRHLPAPQPEKPVVVDDQTPDHGAGKVSIPDPPFFVPKQRLIIPVGEPRGRRIKLPETRGKLPSGDVATGPGEGRGKRVRKARIYAKTDVPGEGVVKQVWNALNSIAHAANLAMPLSVTLTASGQPLLSPELKLLTLLPSQKPEPENSEEERYLPSAWDYVGVYDNGKPVDGQKRPRGLLIARLRYDSKDLYVVEVERRLRLKQENGDANQATEGDKVSEDSTASKAETQVANESPDEATGLQKSSPIAQQTQTIYEEEAFKGLMFTVPVEYESAVGLWLVEMRELIRSNKGVMREVSAKASTFGQATTFMHTTQEGEGLAFSGVLVRKMIALKFLPQGTVIPPVNPDPTPPTVVQPGTE